jgi:hypothetical protein
MKAYVAALAAVVAFAAPSFAQAPEAPAAEAAAKPAKPAMPISHFFGVFQGDTTVVEGAGAGTEAAGRGSRVEIKADGTGFIINWSTTYIDVENPSELKTKGSTEIAFDASSDPKVFTQRNAPAIGTGKPYYWARIDGDTLNVSALALDADRTYDVVHYARTVQGDSQRVEFTRFKDGLLDRSVTGTLKRVAE